MKRIVFRFSKFVLFLLFNSAFSQTELPPIHATRTTKNIYKLYINDYVNIVVFSGTDGLLLVDSGFEETADQVKNELDRQWGTQVRYLINTHVDGDHTGGNPVLGEGAVIAAHRNCRGLLVDVDEFPESGLPSLIVDDEVSIHFDSEEIRIIPLTGCHSGEDLIVHFVGNQVVCLGDAVISNSFPFIRLDRGASIQQLIDNLDRLISMFSDDVTFIVSHGRDMTIRDLKIYKIMLEETTAVVSEAMDAGKSLEKMKQENVLKKWEGWNNKQHTWINTDFWIDSIYRELSNK